MQIKKQRMGPLGTNCYLVWEEDSQEAMLIDPAGRPERIAEILEGFEGQVKYIVLTHGHPDHVSGVKAAKELTKAPTLIHRLDAPMLADHDNMISRYVGITEPLPEPDQLLDGGEKLQLGKLVFEVIHTPGHTEGGIVIFGEGVLFSGDTLFAGSIGRYDLPGGNWDVLKDSLRHLMTLPGDTVVYPGHGEATTIAEEVANNRYLPEL
ncbi:MAG: MBL fold metallo-hydrolase [Firmicutes bacterium]|nr:MBL fold metallo-hydrolase [Bacillota bacterium]